MSRPTTTPLLGVPVSDPELIYSCRDVSGRDFRRQLMKYKGARRNCSFVSPNDYSNLKVSCNYDFEMLEDECGTRRYTHLSFSESEFPLVFGMSPSRFTKMLVRRNDQQRRGVILKPIDPCFVVKNGMSIRNDDMTSSTLERGDFCVPEDMSAIDAGKMKLRFARQMISTFGISPRTFDHIFGAPGIKTLEEIWGWSETEDAPARPSITTDSENRGIWS